MIKEFANKWDKYKNDLEDYFRNTEQKEYCNYKKIVEILFEKIINRDYEYDSDKYDTKNILNIDDGYYQGTEIFILHKDCYQPSIDEYVYSHTYYGSCSGCDTLLAICDFLDSDGKPNEEQINDYMRLSLHLLQKCKYMGEKYEI